jgi:sulfate permease, SulP family
VGPSQDRSADLGMDHHHLRRHRFDNGRALLVPELPVSLLLLIARASNPGIRLLGKHPQSDAYLDVERHEGLIQTRGVVVVRVDRAAVLRRRQQVPRPSQATRRGGRDGPRGRYHAEAFSQTDTDGADILIELEGDLNSRGAILALARVQSSILDLWRRAGAIDAIGTDRVFHTTAEAVEAVSGPSAPRITRSG